MLEPRTNTVILPLGTEAVVRESNADTDDLLYAKREMIHEALPDYWAACTVSLNGRRPITRNDILDLLEPEQVALAIEIYRVSYGDELVLGGDCPGCGEPMGNAVDLGEIARQGTPGRDAGKRPPSIPPAIPPLHPPVYGGTEGGGKTPGTEAGTLPNTPGRDAGTLVNTPDPVFTYTLPRLGHQVEYGFLTGRQMLEELQRRDVKPSRMLLARIRRVDGEPPRQADIARWPGGDYRALREDMDRNRAGYDPRVRLRHSCGWKGVINLLTDPQFLFPAMPMRT